MKRARFQLLVLWHARQFSPLGMWRLDLPLALVPLWQLAQRPSTRLWSTLRMVFQVTLV